MGSLLYGAGFVFSVLMVGCGVLLISGLMMPEFSGGVRMRVMFGVVVVLYGVLRFVQTWISARQASKSRD